MTDPGSVRPATTYMDRSRPGPRLVRRISLRMMGDWGVANLHRICGWLGAEVGARSGAGSESVIFSGSGGSDAIDAVLDGRVDTALMVPAGFGRTAFERRGISRRHDVHRLRALATFPQDDRLVFAVDASLGVSSLDDIRRLKPALRIATAWDNGINLTGYAAHRLLEVAGLPRETIEAWGGALLEGETPWDVIPRATRGEANAVLFEAVMTPFWKQLLAARKMSFIPIDDATLRVLEDRFGWQRNTVPADRFAGLERPFETLDFSDFLFLCRDDLPSDLAHLIAWCAVETRANIEGQYRHIPPRDSPLSYPLEPARMARTSIPLHEGARQYYADQQLL